MGLTTVGRGIYLLLCKIRFEKIGSNVSISRRAKFERPNRIALGDNVTIQDNVLLSAVKRISSKKRIKIDIGDNCTIHRGAMLLSYKGSITLGRNCTVNSYSILYGHGNLRIGNDVRIDAGTIIIPTNHVFDRTDIPIFKQGITAKGITIEDDIWIGANVTILDGVRIGRGSIIGSGSVVREDVLPYSIVAGVPARFIKKRKHE